MYLRRMRLVMTQANMKTQWSDRETRNR